MKRARDDGNALVMVLVFVLVVGLVSVALLAQARANFTTSRVTRDLQNRVYAADAGLKWGLQELRRNDAIVCNGIGPGATPVRILDLGNGTTARVHCEVTSGLGPGAGGWAVFITDPNGGISTQGAANTTKLIQGPVYNAGGQDGWSLQALLEVRGGDVYQDRAGGCSRPPRLTVSPPELYSYSCPTTSIPRPPSPQPIPTAPPAVAPAPTTYGSGRNVCRVFQPGRYTTSNQLQLASNNYFTSGVYYLDNIGEWEIRADVVAGRPAPSESRQTAILDCPGMPPDTSPTTGALFILGGNSWINLTNQGRLEIFSYLGFPGATPDAPAVSIYGLLGTEPGWGGARSTAPVALQTAGGNKPELAVHGNVYVPTASVDLQATNQSVAKLQGGVVAASVSMQASASIGNGLEISTQSVPGERRIVLKAYGGDPTAATKEVSATTAVRIRNDSVRTMTVESWAVTNP